MTHFNFSKWNRLRRESARAFERANRNAERGRKEEAEKEFAFMMKLERKAGELVARG